VLLIGCADARPLRLQNAIERRPAALPAPYAQPISSTPPPPRGRATIPTRAVRSPA